jgi:hypothetical protein
MASKDSEVSEIRNLCASLKTAYFNIDRRQRLKYVEMKSTEITTAHLPYCARRLHLSYKQPFIPTSAISSEIVSFLDLQVWNDTLIPFHLVLWNIAGKLKLE